MLTVALGTSAALPPPPRRAGLAPFLSVLAFGAIAASLLWWAKWSPYSLKLSHLWSTRAWTGHDLMAKAGAPGASPSLSGAWAFTRAYFDAVWMALVAGIVIAAALQALVPSRWLLGVLARRSAHRSALLGGLLALPSLMCTCCSAPVVATLGRRGAPTSATLAYWLGNPVLNPAVLAFLALVAPWQWVTVRLVAGGVLVFAATPLVARMAGRSRPAVAAAAEPEDTEPHLASAPAVFARSLLRLALTLLPEYLVVVFLLGLLRGWLLPLGGHAVDWPLLATVLAATLGTLVVVPTAGEIPILQGLALAGVGSGATGALLITLPAISLASMAMVARALSVRLVVLTAAAVAACGLLGAGLLVALDG